MPKKGKGELIFPCIIILYILLYYFTDIAPFHSDTHIKAFVLLIMGALLALLALQIVVLLIDREFVHSLRFRVSELFPLVKDQILALVLCTAVYLLLIPVAGFFLMTFIYFVVVLWFLNIRKKLVLLFVPLIYNAVMFYIFDYLLNVRFPRGVLF